MQTNSVALLASALAVVAGAAFEPRSKTSMNRTIQFYGYADRNPVGSYTNYTCNARGPIAGGSGSFHDPLTFAAPDGGTFKKCEVVYCPYVRKYLQFQDICQDCLPYFPDSTTIWIGSAFINGGENETDCGLWLTDEEDHAVILDPAHDKEVYTGPLYDLKTGHCYQDRIYPLGP